MKCKRKCENCTYALAFFDANEADKKSRKYMACKHGNADKPNIVPIDNVCKAHLFKGTVEDREGRRE